MVEFFFAESNQNSRSGILFLQIFNCELKEINFIPMCFRLLEENFHTICLEIWSLQHEWCHDFHFFLEVETNSDQYLFLGNRARHKWLELESLPELESQPNSKDLIRARFDSSAITRVVTGARVGFRARVTYFELGFPGTNIDPPTWFFLLCLTLSGLRNFVVDCHI